MGRRLPLLNGFAILAVVSSHATGWGYMAMVWWADRYRPVEVPNFDQLYTPSYYALVAIQGNTIPELGVPIVPLDPVGDDLFEVSYSDFTEAGLYRVVVYASDNRQNYALPKLHLVQVSRFDVYLPLVMRDE